MSSYDLISDFSDPNNVDVIETNAYWVVAVMRLKYPITYRRASKSSFSTYFPKAVELRGSTLIITSDCTSLSVSTTKSNHIGQMQAVLRPGEANYLAEIMPGDYLFSWMLNDEAAQLDLINRIKAGEPCNNFMDGIKFFGIVQSLTKSLNQMSDGKRTVSYNLTGTGNTELDATLYQDPQLSERINTIGRYLGRLNSDLNTLTTKGYLDINKAIPTLFDIMVGKGIPKNFGAGSTGVELHTTAGTEGDYAYILPPQVGALLGKTKSSKAGGILAYADVVELNLGIQSYSGTPTYGESFWEKDPAKQQAREEDRQKARPFTAFYEGNGLADSPRRKTGPKMLGSFTPQMPRIADISVWSILNQYLNPAINEMYMALRTNANGQIVPTIVVRQLPFTSELFDGKSSPGDTKQLYVTKFLDLPRWKVHPALVKSATLGRSNALRFNFINVQGQAPGNKAAGSIAQSVRNLPVRDDLDIARHGIRPYTMTVPSSFEDVGAGSKTGGPGTTAATDWMALISDMIMGGHLLVTGTINLVGIQAPICVGDNVEFDGVVFHIESINHQCSIQGDGRKIFSTSLALSHGVKAASGATAPGIHKDVAIYAGIYKEDQMDYNPEVSDDGQQLGNELGTSLGDVEGAVGDEQRTRALETAWNLPLIKKG